MSQAPTAEAESLADDADEALTQATTIMITPTKKDASALNGGTHPGAGEFDDVDSAKAGS